MKIKIDLRKDYELVKERTFHNIKYFKHKELGTLLKIVFNPYSQTSIIILVQGISNITLGELKGKIYTHTLLNFEYGIRDYDMEKLVA